MSFQFYQKCQQQMWGNTFRSFSCSESCLKKVNTEEFQNSSQLCEAKDTKNGFKVF